MNWTHCVIDASMGSPWGMFTFYPVEGDINGDYKIVTEMDFVSTVPPRGMKLVAIIHPDGAEAVERFCAENEAALEALAAKTAEESQ